MILSILFPLTIILSENILLEHFQIFKLFSVFHRFKITTNFFFFLVTFFFLLNYFLEIRMLSDQRVNISMLVIRKNIVTVYKATSNFVFLPFRVFWKLYRLWRKRISVFHRIFQPH